jgi:hypothetical protein
MVHSLAFLKQTALVIGLGFADILVIAQSPRCRADSVQEGGGMERAFFFGGIAGVVAGFCVMFYQVIMFLKLDSWTSYTVFSAINKESASLVAFLASYPAVTNALQRCPLAATFLAIGCLLLWASSRIRGR